MEATTWEYRYFRPGDSETAWTKNWLQRLNQLGSEGWEVCSQLSSGGDSDGFLLKRRATVGAGAPQSEADSSRE